MRNFTLLVVVLLGSLWLTGCGGGSSQTSPPAQPASPQQLPRLAGTWHSAAPHSQNGVNTSVTFIDFNLTQTGSTITASQVAILNVKFNSGPGDFNNATWSPQNCVPGPYSLSGTVSAPNALSFTLQETGGQITGTATEGTGPEAGVLSGTYSDPSCSGNNIQFVGGQTLTLAGKYSNTCSFNPCGTADPSLTLQVTQDSSYHLTISGSDTKNGSFALSGTAIGSTMWVSGAVSGQNVSWYGWHYAALDKNLQEIFIIDADTNAPVAIVQGCINTQPCTPAPL